MQSKGIILNSISDCDKIESNSSSCLMFDIIMVKTKDDTWEDISECEEGESGAGSSPLCHNKCHTKQFIELKIIFSQKRLTK